MTSDKSQRLIRLDQLRPGQPERVEHQGKGVLLCLVDHTVYAVDDLCTHEDISLSLGVLCEYRLRCPLHGSEFDIRTGEVQFEPAEENLTTYPLEIRNEWVCLKNKESTY